MLKTIMIANTILLIVIWYILLRNNKSLIGNKKIVIGSTFLLAIEYIYINLQEFHYISFIGIFTFAIMVFLINYFWYLLYDSKKIIENKNILLDYEPIIWPLYIANINKINKKIKNKNLNSNILKIKIIALLMLIVIFNFILTTSAK